MTLIVNDPNHKQAKLLGFQYILSKLFKWQIDNKETPSISNLRAFKLLFLLSAIDNKKEEKDSQEDKNLLYWFNNFFAYQYGPVEEDIRSQISNMGYYEYELNKGFTEVRINNNPLEAELDTVVEKKFKKAIDDSFNCLTGNFASLLRLSDIELISVTHSWTSWEATINLSKAKKCAYLRMPTEYIEMDAKSYFG